MKKQLTIFLLCLLGSVLLLGSYALITREKTNENNTSEKRELTNDEKNLLIGRLETYNYLTSKNRGDIKDIDLNEIYKFLIKDVGEDISYGDLQKKAKDYFGSDYKLELTDKILCDCGEVLMEYNDDSNIFEYNYEHGHGLDRYISQDKVYIVNDFYENGKYYLDLNIVYKHSLTSDFYADPNDEEPFFSAYDDIALEEGNAKNEDIFEYEFSDNDYQKYQSKLNITRVEFIRENNNYYLQSFKVLEK